MRTARLAPITEPSPCLSARGPPCNRQAKRLFQEKFQTGKNRWFFNKLRF